MACAESSRTVTDHPVTDLPDSVDEPGGRARLRLLRDVAEQLAREAGLDLTVDLADLVTIAYVGLLDTPGVTDITHQQLLHRSRGNLLRWAWEQGVENRPLPRHTIAPDPSPSPGLPHSPGTSPTVHGPRAVSLQAVERR
jgi:hypothetical protein